MKKVLITGGAGYIGSHAVKLFLKKGFEVVVFDNLSRGFKQALEPLKKLGPLTFVKGDLRNPKEIEAAFKKHKIDGVLHFAALCSVNESMEKPGLYFENNSLGTFNLLEAMRKENVKRLIFSSTCAVYGEAKYLPVDEKHQTNPSNPYGESKLISEKMLSWYGNLHGLKFIILRYFNVCGSDDEGRIGDSKKPSALLVQNAVRGAMNIEPFAYTCPKVKTPDGTPIRDYIDVKDLVEAHYLAYKYIRNEGSKNERVNLWCGRGISVKEIVTAVEKEFDTTMVKRKAPPRKGEYAKMYANPKAAKKLLGWKPTRSIKDSIQSLRKWYTSRPNGYKF